MAEVSAVSVAAIEEGRAGEYEMVSKKEESVKASRSPDIEWVNLSMSVNDGKKKILRSCWGSVSEVLRIWYTFVTFSVE